MRSELLRFNGVVERGLITVWRQYLVSAYRRCKVRLHLYEYRVYPKCREGLLRLLPPTQFRNNFLIAVPAQVVDATLACSLRAGVSKPRVFLGRWFKRSETWSSCA